jgi:hypothetical protein
MSTTKNTYKIPDPLAPDSEKATNEYGLQMCHFMESEWFNGGIMNKNCNFMTRRDWIRKKRLFIRGEGSTENDKSWISRNDGDLDYINLDWEQLNISQKFCRIVSNGISDKFYNLDIRSTDALSVKLKQDRINILKTKMYAKPMLERYRELSGIDLTPKGFVPEDEEELNLFIEIKDRPKIEIAEEIMIKYTKDVNDYEYIEKTKNKNLVDIGIASARIWTDSNDGIKVKSVNPENYGHSMVEKEDFSDAFYHFEVDTISINDIKRESGFDNDTLRKIAKKQAGPGSFFSEINYDTCSINDILDMRINVMRFAYKSAKTITYKKVLNKKGQIKKVAKKDDNFNPPENMKELKSSKTLDTWYEGNYIIGADTLYGYKECENLVRDDMNKALPPFVTIATNIYENKLRSFLSDIEPMAKQLQRQHLKIQQLVAELKPDLIEIDLDSLANLEQGDGNKKKENWVMALNLLNTKGVVLKERVDMGEMGMKDSSGARPMSNSQGSALAPLLNTWAHYYNLIRDITGVNPARDGSLPADALLGVNKMAELASNTVTKDIVDAATWFNKKVSEVISTRIHSIFKHDKSGYLRRIYENAVGKHLVDSLEVLADRSLHEFGFIIEMVPAQKELDKLAEDLGIAMKEGTIDVEDKIETERIAKTNIKLALEYMKYRRRKRIKQRLEEQSMLQKEKSQNDIASAQAAQAAKTQAYAQQKEIDLEYEAKSSVIRLNEFAEKQRIEAPVREEEFNQEVYLERIKSATKIESDAFKEQAKDARLDRQASQNSEMIEQRKNDSGPIDFENTFDIENLFQN